MKSNPKPRPITEYVPFDRLMRGLISVPKAEVDAEERKYRKERGQAGQARGQAPKPKK